MILLVVARNTHELLAHNMAFRCMAFLASHEIGEVAELDECGGSPGVETALRTTC